MKTTVTVICCIAFSFVLRSQPNPYIVRGIILGLDGRPTTALRLYLVSNSPRGPRLALDSVTVSREGKFQIGFPLPGLYRLQFTATNGSSLELPVLLVTQGPIHVTIRLQNQEGQQTAPDPDVHFDTIGALSARFYDTHLFLQKELRRFSDARDAQAKATGKEIRDFKYDFMELKNRIQLESYPILRNLLVIWTVRLGATYGNKDRATSILNSISPSDIMWSYEPKTVIACIYDSKGERKFVPYLEQIITGERDQDLKPYYVLELLDLAKRTQMDSLIPRYYQMLVSNFGNSGWTRMAMNRFAPSRNIQVGRVAPHFAVTSMQDSTVIYTNKTFLGKVYLVDFWAVWCGPCVGEMQYLHQAYQQFKSRGFTILSASGDISPQDVAKFRKEHWPMPWLHTYLKNGSGNEFAKTFEVMALPKPILVGPDGKILATDDELRGPKLQATLSRVFKQ